MQRLVSPSATVALAASSVDAAPRRRRRARRRAPREWIIPQSAASAPVTCRPSRSSSLARATPTSRGSEPRRPAVGGEAPLGERQPEVAALGRDGEVRRRGRSGSRARRPSRAPTHTTGSWISSRTAMRRWACSAVRRWRLPGRGFWPPALLAATQSAPVQKSSPVLVMSTARSVSSVVAASSASTMRRTAAGVSEPLRSGRSMTRRRTESTTSTTTPSTAAAVIGAPRPASAPSCSAWCSPVPKVCSSTHARFSR